MRGALCFQDGKGGEILHSGWSCTDSPSSVVDHCLPLSTRFFHFNKVDFDGGWSGTAVHHPLPFEDCCSSFPQPSGPRRSGPPNGLTPRWLMPSISNYRKCVDKSNANGDLHMGQDEHQIRSKARGCLCGNFPPEFSFHESRSVRRPGVSESLEGCAW